MADKEEGQDQAPMEYTIHNYDAVNRAVEGNLLITESKANWFREAVNELRAMKILLLTSSLCALLLTAGFLYWFFADAPATERSDALTPEERQQIFDQHQFRRGQEYVLFEEVEHVLGEDVITARAYRYPDTETPVDQWCHLATSGVEIVRYADDRAGLYNRTESFDLLQFEDACRFIQAQ